MKNQGQYPQFPISGPRKPVLRILSLVSSRRGSTILETVMYLPMLIVLLFGMVEIARVTYTYYTLQKILYTLARHVGTSQAVNFCDSSDAVVAAAKNFALTGSSDGSADPLVPNLTVDQIEVRIERLNRDTGEIAACDCSIAGCDAAQGGTPPEYLVVSIPDGYRIRPIIPYMALEEFPLRPRIRVPFGGT
jgi:hypothetical protein